MGLLIQMARLRMRQPLLRVVRCSLTSWPLLRLGNHLLRLCSHLLWL